MSGSYANEILVTGSNVLDAVPIRTGARFVWASVRHIMYMCVMSIPHTFSGFVLFINLFLFMWYLKYVSMTGAYVVSVTHVDNGHYGKFRVIYRIII